MPINLHHFDEHRILVYLAAINARTQIAIHRRKLSTIACASFYKKIAGKTYKI